MAARKKKKRLGRKQSMDQMCKWCIYDPIAGEGNWRQQVSACTSTSCPLWAWRPKSKPKKAPVLGVQGPESGDLESDVTRHTNGSENVA